VYTALFVDDEPSVIETLRSSIHWQQFGVDTLLSASDGRQALTLFSGRTIHLLIADIRMPHMGGLELLQAVRTASPDTRCILLTAYGEFDYAREAIKLGVENYLLKPLRISEMEETIEKAVNSMYVSHTDRKQLFRDSILSRWASGTIGSEDLAERAAILNINIYRPGYCAVCIRKKQTAVSIALFCSACTERFSKKNDIHLFCDDADRCVFIIGADEIDLKNIAGTFRSIAAEKDLQASLVVSVGPVVPDSGLLYQSYRTACRNLELADVSASDVVIAQKNNYPSPETDVLSEEIVMLFHSENEAERSAGYEKLAEHLMESGNTCKATHLAVSGLLQVFMNSFPDRSDIHTQLQSRIQICLSLSERSAIVSVVRELFEYGYLLYQYYFDRFSSVIQQAIGYIHDCYVSGLSIEEFCAKRRMNTSYLGYLFKKETGMFFNTYLLQFRVSRACYLLKNTDIKICDIARQVGFSSVSYFISCFRQQTSLSPKKYRIMQPEEDEKTPDNT
jgi:two-component system, response regulator YesN